MTSKQSALRNAVKVSAPFAAPLLLGLCFASLSDTTEKYALGSIEQAQASLITSDSQLAYFSGGGTGGNSNMGNTTGGATSNKGGGADAGASTPSGDAGKGTTGGTSKSPGGGGTQATGGNSQNMTKNPGGPAKQQTGGNSQNMTNNPGGPAKQATGGNSQNMTKNPGGPAKQQTGGNSQNMTNNPNSNTPAGGCSGGGGCDSGAAQARRDAVAKAQTQQQTAQKQTDVGNFARSLAERFGMSGLSTPTTPTTPKSVTPSRSLQEALGQPYNMANTATDALAAKAASEARVAAAERTEALANSLTRGVSATDDAAADKAKAIANANKESASLQARYDSFMKAEATKDITSSQTQEAARRQAESDARTAQAQADAKSIANEASRVQEAARRTAESTARMAQEAADAKSISNEASRVQEAARRTAETNARMAQEAADERSTRVAAIDKANAEARSLSEIAADGLRSAWNSLTGNTPTTPTKTAVADPSYFGDINTPTKPANVTTIAKNPAPTQSIADAKSIVSAVSPAERALMAGVNPNSTVVAKTTMPSAPADDVQDLTEAAARKAGVAEPSTDVPATSCAGCGPTYDQALRELKAPVQSRDPGLTPAQNAQSIQNATPAMTQADAARVNNVTTASISKAPTTATPNSMEAARNAQRAADAKAAAQTAAQNADKVAQTSAQQRTAAENAATQSAAARARSEAVANADKVAQTSAQQRSVAEQNAVNAKARETADKVAQTSAQQRAAAEKAAVDAKARETADKVAQTSAQQRTVAEKAAVDAKTVSDKAAATVAANKAEISRLENNLKAQEAQRQTAKTAAEKAANDAEVARLQNNLDQQRTAQQKALAESSAADAKARQAAEASAQQRAVAEKAAVDAKAAQAAAQANQQEMARLNQNMMQQVSQRDALARQAAETSAQQRSVAEQAAERAAKVAAVDKAVAESRSLSEIAADGLRSAWNSLTGNTPTTPTKTAVADPSYFGDINTPTNVPTKNTNVTDLGKVPAGSTEVTQPSGYPAKEQGRLTQSTEPSVPGFNANLPANQTLKDTLKGIAAQQAAEGFRTPANTPTGINSPLGDIGTGDLGRAVTGADPSTPKTTKTAALADRPNPGISVENTSGLNNTRTAVADKTPANNVTTASTRSISQPATTPNSMMSAQNAQRAADAAAQAKTASQEQEAARRQAESNARTAQTQADAKSIANAQSAAARARSEAVANADKVAANPSPNSMEAARNAQRAADAQVAAEKAAANPTPNSMEAARNAQRAADAAADAKTAAEKAAEPSAWSKFANAVTGFFKDAPPVDNTLGTAPYSNLAEKTNPPTANPTNVPTKTAVADPSYFGDINAPTKVPTKTTVTKTYTERIDGFGPIPGTGVNDPNVTQVRDVNVDGIPKNPTYANQKVTYNNAGVRTQVSYDSNGVAVAATRTGVPTGVTTASVSKPATTPNSMMAAENAKRAAEAEAAGEPEDLRAAAAKQAGVNVKAPTEVGADVPQRPTYSDSYLQKVVDGPADLRALVTKEQAQAELSLRGQEALADIDGKVTTPEKAVADVKTPTRKGENFSDDYLKSVVEGPKDMRSLISKEEAQKEIDFRNQEAQPDNVTETSSTDPSEEQTDAEIEKKETSITKIAIDAWNKLSWYVNGTQNRKNEEARIANREGGGNNNTQSNNQKPKPVATSTKDSTPIVEQSWWQKFLSTFTY